MKKVKAEQIGGLSIPQESNVRQFRTKAKTLVATGYEKVQRDDDGVVRVYFKEAQVNERNLIEVEHQGSMVYGSSEEPRPAKYNSRDAIKAEFVRPFNITGGHPLMPRSLWKVAAVDLYVDGVPVYIPPQ